MSSFKNLYFLYLALVSIVLVYSLCDHNTYTVCPVLKGSWAQNTSTLPLMLIYTSFASLYSFIYLKLWASNIDDSFRILLPVQMSQVIEQHLCLTLCLQLKQL